MLLPWEMVALIFVSTVVFFVAAWHLNTLALVLAPVAAGYVVLYSFAKYTTWLTHFVLGWADGLAPAGAWIAVTGSPGPEAVLVAAAVAAWVGGFDVMYSCTDYEFDGRYGVHSAPRRFGIGRSLWLAKGMHLVTSALLLALGVWMGLSFPYYVGWALVTAMLTYENSLLKPGDLSKMDLAFFRINSNIGLVLLLATVLGVVI